MISTTLCSGSLFHSSLSSNLLSISSSVFFIQLSHSTALVHSFFIFPSSLLKFSLWSSILLTRSVIIFMTIILNYLSSRLLISISFGSFSEVLSYSFIGAYSSVSSFRLNFCVYLYVFGRSVTSPNLGELTLCMNSSMGPQITLPFCSPELKALSVSPM